MDTCGTELAPRVLAAIREIAKEDYTLLSTKQHPSAESTDDDSINKNSVTFLENHAAVKPAAIEATATETTATETTAPKPTDATLPEE